jgi:hypothetical protein
VRVVEAAVEAAVSQAGALAAVEVVACVRIHGMDKDVSAMGGGGSAGEHAGRGNPRSGLVGARGFSPVRGEKARRRPNAVFALENL